MRSIIRIRIGMVAVASGTLVLAGAGSASAHECFVAKRSTQGALGAAHSGMWAPVPREELVAELPGLLAELGITDLSQVECVVDGAEATLPEIVAIGVGPAKGTDGVIAANMNPKNAANGVGIDHLEAVLGGLLGSCGIEAPPAG